MAISPGGRPADASPVGTPGGQQNWVDKAGGLPKYIRMVAHALMRKGMPKQHAIASAVNRIKRWAAGMDDVRPQVQAAAVAALAEWNAKKGMALSAHVDAAQLLDMSVPDVWLAELEGTFDPARTLDLAREYVRDQVGKFANDNTKNRGADQHRAAQEDEKRIERNRQVRPADLSSLKGIRQLMLDWRRVPFTERAANKARMKSAARRLGATPRLLALIDGLGDGDMKAEKSEGAGVALRHDKANAWLKSQGFNLSTDDTEGGLVLELAAAVGDELDSASLIDLAGAPGDVIDLAPGDYHPPYDWKHGFIPVTPAAALSKAKKGPHVGKGNSRRPKGVRVPGKGRVSAPNAGKARATTAAGARGKVAQPPHPRTTDVRGIQDRIEKRTGKRPTFAQALAALEHAERIESDAPSVAHAKALDDEKRGRGVPGAVEATRPDAFPVNQLPAREKRDYADLTPEGQKAYRIERKGGANHRDARTAGRRAQTKPTRSPGHQELADLDKARGQTVNMPPPTSSDAVQRSAVKTNQGPESDSPLSTAQLEEMAKSNRPAIRDAAKRQLEKRKGNVTPIRGGTGSGDYPKKADGSPDYAAMSATQQHQVRAKLAGRGEGDKVDTDQGPGTVTRVSSRGTTIRLDSGGSINVVNGTPGHDRIKPRGSSPKGGAADSGESFNRKTELEGGPSATPSSRSERLSAERQSLEKRAKAAGYDGNLIGDGSDRLEAFLDAKAKGHPIPVGRSVNARQPGIEHVTTGRVVGYTDNGMVKIEAHVDRNGNRPGPVGTFNPSHVAEAGKPLRNTPDSRTSGGAPSTTTPTTFPDGQKVAYNGRPSDGTGVVVGRRTDSHGTVLEVRDDKDGKTYEWAPDHVKPHDTASGPAFGGRTGGVRTPEREQPWEPRPGSAPSTSSTNPDAAIRIEHTPDGTLVHGTTREDAAAIKEVGGFKWSRNLNAWYLPRTWRPETRENKVRQLEAKLGDRAGVDKTTGPRKSAAERDADTRTRAGERAERMDARADKRSAEAERRFEAADLREEKSGIPFGQPILVGHHSERRHRRALDRAHANMGKGVEAQRDAESARASADRARRTAAGTESKVTIGNRIAKNEREVRDLERRLNGTHSSSRRKPEGEYRQRLEGMLAEAQDQLQHDRGKMAAAGGVPSKDSVSPGDFVKIRGQWYPVRKSNAKTVGVPNTYGDRTRTAPWHEVSEHRKAGDVTRADVADMVRDTSQAFPNLKTALAKAAPDTDPTPAGQSAGAATPAATPGGVTPDAARRMSDDQLERTMQRLMADGDYDGPAFSVIEKELNRRDKARRAEGN